MAASLAAIMAGLKTRLATVSGLQAYDYVPDSPTPPCAFPLVPDFDYRASMGRGTYVIPFRIVVLTGAQLDRDGQHKLAGYVDQTGDSSVRAAVEGDKTLGGIVSDVVVDSFNSSGLEEVGLVGYYGGVFTVRVIATGV